MIKLILLTATVAFCLTTKAQTTTSPDTTDWVARGKYVTEISGCNDCHTPNYGQAAGNVSESQLLIGSTTGFKGSWGTSYPTNLRHLIAQMSEARWIAHARTLKALPPMPWYALNIMSDDDLRAMYRYILYLGDSDQQIPDSLDPGVTPTTPYINYDPVIPSATPAGAKALANGETLHAGDFLARFF